MPRAMLDGVEQGEDEKFRVKSLVEQSGQQESFSILRDIDLHVKPSNDRDNRRTQPVGFSHTLLVFRYTCM